MKTYTRENQVCSYKQENLQNTFQMRDGNPNCKMKERKTFSKQTHKPKDRIYRPLSRNASSPTPNNTTIIRRRRKTRLAAITRQQQAKPSNGRQDKNLEKKKTGGKNRQKGLQGQTEHEPKVRNAGEAKAERRKTRKKLHGIENTIFKLLT